MATEEMEDTDDNEYQANAAVALKLAKSIAVEVFGIENPSRQIINGVRDRVVFVDDEGVVVTDDTEDSKEDLIAAKAWALDVYGEDSPEATFDAYDRAFDAVQSTEDEINEKLDTLLKKRK